jgi:cell division protein FtsL
MTLTLGCLFSVRARTLVIRERYLLEQANSERERLQTEQSRLQLQWATLTSPKRLRALAAGSYRLHTPRPEEIVVMP